MEYKQANFIQSFKSKAFEAQLNFVQRGLTKANSSEALALLDPTTYGRVN